VTVLDLLKAKWTIYGLDAPVFAWLAAVGLLLGTLCVLAWLAWLVRRECARHHEVARQLDAIAAAQPAHGQDGLPRAAYDAIVNVFANHPPLLPAWQRFQAQLVVRRQGPSDPRLWASESAEGAFNDSTVVEPRLNRSFFTAIPGIVTGAGLLITFLAILVALLDVRIEDNRVQGIENLIQGLSGKFVSSIAALAAATIYLLLEKPLLHRLANGQRRLVASIDAAVPRLAPARIFADIQRDIAEQTAAIRQANAGLPAQLQHSLSQTLGPPLQHLSTIFEEVKQELRAGQRQGQDAIAGSLGDLLERLEHTLTTALGDIGARFSESLSGSAQREFARVLNALGDTAHLLEGMNAQFHVTQSGLNELLTLARTSTAEQMALGKSQVEELTGLMRGLMAQLHESAGLSVTNMTAALTAVVHDLSTKVDELGQRMAGAVADSAQQATGAAHIILERANAWSASNTEQLAELLARHRSHVRQVEDVRDTLDTTLVRLREALGHYTAVTADLKSTATDLKAVAVAAAAATKSMKEASETAQRVVSLTEKQADRLAESLRHQDEAWQKMQGSLRQYQQVFGQVETAASQLFMQIDHSLHNYREVVKQGFEEVVQVADGHFKNAVQHLGASIGDLDEALQYLNEILEQARLGGGSHERKRR
jgi:hypothetical protein